MNVYSPSCWCLLRQSDEAKDLMTEADTRSSSSLPEKAKEILSFQGSGSRIDSQVCTIPRPSSRRILSQDEEEEEKTKQNKKQHNSWKRIELTWRRWWRKVSQRYRQCLAREGVLLNEWEVTLDLVAVLNCRVNWLDMYIYSPVYWLLPRSRQNGAPLHIPTRLQLQLQCRR